MARITLGATLLARPEVIPRALGVDSVTAARLDWLGRMAGVRDLTLGAGALWALARRRSPSAWLAASGAVDAGDAIILAAASRGGNVAPVRAVLLSVTAAVGAAGSFAAIGSSTSD